MAFLGVCDEPCKESDELSPEAPEWLDSRPSLWYTLRVVKRRRRPVTLTPPRTDKEMVLRAREMGMSARKTGHGQEWRIAYPDITDPADREAKASYQDGREDAFWTMVRMVEDSH